jgi:hypothetical protein
MTVCVRTKRGLAPPSSTSDHVARARASVRAKARCGRERVVRQRGRGRRICEPAARRCARPAGHGHVQLRARARELGAADTRTCGEAAATRVRERLVEPGLRRCWQARELIGARVGAVARQRVRPDVQAVECVVDRGAAHPSARGSSRIGRHAPRVLADVQVVPHARPRLLAA